MREIYFHEDDYLMCELQPIALLDTIKEQMGFVSNSQTEAHVGFKEVIKKPEVSIEHLGITYNKVYQILCEQFTPFDKISNKVFVSYDLEPANLEAAAFGNNNENVVFFSFDKKTQIIKHIWFSLYPADEKALVETKKLFSLLLQLGDFLLVDWYSETIFSLKDLNAIDHYCGLLLTFQ